MRSRSLLTQHQREQAVVLFEAGVGAKAAARQLGVSYQSVHRLEQRWKLHGRLCLMEKPSKQQFSYEIKKEVVDRFHAGEPKTHLAMEFSLSSPKLVETWARLWRNGGDDALRPKPKGRPKGSGKPVALTTEEKLRRENRRLQAENAYLKKLRDLRDQGHA